MSKITIREVDETTVGQQLIESTDVVYIPGFSVLSPTDDQIIGKPHVPQLCRTIAEFERYFGGTVPTFNADQKYPSEFSSLAVPTDISGTPRNMFDQDSPDPSYIYAKELLAQGLPVLYERVNEIGESISVDAMYAQLDKIFEKSADTTVVGETHEVDIPEFSATSTYAVNDIVQHNDIVYQCKVAVETAGAWDASDWTEISAVEDYGEFDVTVNSDDMYDTFYDTDNYTFVYEKYPEVATSYSNDMKAKMAPAYNEKSTYIAQDHVLYENNIFECISTITVPEKFNSAHWKLSTFIPTVFVDVNFTMPLDNKEYTFTYTGAATNPWTVGVDGTTTQVADLTSYGITVTGELDSQQTNVITVNNNYELGWVRKNVYYGQSTLTCGITISNVVGGSLIEGSTFTVYLESIEPLLIDRGLYSFKYLTTGGYPTFEYADGFIARAMANLCQRRGDAVALIDHTDNPSRPLTGTKSVYYCATKSSNMLPYAVQSFAAMFTPCVDMSLSANYRGWSWKEGAIIRLPSTMVFPPSFAYLSCLASSIKLFPNWNAIAGATRGKVIGLVAPRTVKALTNAIADSYTPDTALAINPITNIKPYGQCIWGNRTLVDNSVKQGTTAVSFLNIRNMVSDIKKQLFVACQSLLFEQNTDVLWVNFLSLVTPTLDKMVSGFGIHNYKIIKLPNSDKTQINVRIRIYPIYAVESFDITIYLNDKGVYLDSEPDNV